MKITIEDREGSKVVARFNKLEAFRKRRGNDETKSLPIHPIQKGKGRILETLQEAFATVVTFASPFDNRKPHHVTILKMFWVPCCDVMVANLGRICP